MEVPRDNKNADATTLAGNFPQTAWSRIARVARDDGEGAREALEELCRRYWLPAREFLRSLGCKEHDADDLTQIFFKRWAQPENFQRLDREKGRLRSYMQQGLRRTFINEWRRSQSRGKGEVSTISIDSDDVPEGFEGTAEAADWVYDKAWAEAVMGSVLGRLRAGYAGRGREEIFNSLRGALPGGEVLKPYAEIAVSIGMTEPQIKLEVHRLRRRFADELRTEISATLANPAEIDDEMRHLVQVMARAETLPDAR